MASFSLTSAFSCGVVGKSDVAVHGEAGVSGLDSTWVETNRRNQHVGVSSRRTLRTWVNVHTHASGRTRLPASTCASLKPEDCAATQNLLQTLTSHLRVPRVFLHDQNVRDESNARGTTYSSAVDRGVCSDALALELVDRGVSATNERRHGGSGASFASIGWMHKGKPPGSRSCARQPYQHDARIVPSEHFHTLFKQNWHLQLAAHALGEVAA